MPLTDILFIDKVVRDILLDMIPDPRYIITVERDLKQSVGQRLAAIEHVTATPEKSVISIGGLDDLLPKRSLGNEHVTYEGEFNIGVYAPTESALKLIVNRLDGVFTHSDITSNSIVAININNFADVLYDHNAYSIQLAMTCILQ